MKLPGVRPGIGTTIKLTRGFVCLLGAGAVAWGLFVLPLFSKAATPQSVAQKLLQDDSFKLRVLMAVTQEAQSVAQQPFCFPAALRGLYVLRFFLLNQIVDNSNPNLTRSSSAPLRNAVQNTLSCSPTDSLAWLTLFWLDAGSYGVNERNTNYLRLSYTFGPNEGWIALWRARLAFLLFQRLPPDLANYAVGDFVKLVDTERLYRETADMFKAASPGVQTRILEQLSRTSLASRESFSIALRDLGVDVDVPGIENSRNGSWR